MAKTNSKKTNKKQITMEEVLWQSAESLRGSVETSEYKHVVLSLFSIRKNLIQLSMLGAVPKDNH